MVEPEGPNIVPIDQKRMREIAEEMGMSESPIVKPMLAGVSDD